MAKPRSDSILKLRAKQSPEFGEKVWQWCLEPKSADSPGGQEHARRQLEADGIKVSISTISDFSAWWELQQDFASAEHYAQDIQEALKALNLGLTTEQLDAAGQLIFTQRAMTARDPEEYREMEYLRLGKETARAKAELETAKLELRKIGEARKQGDSALQRQKFQRETCALFLKWMEDERAKQISASGATNAEKIEALGQQMFGEDWNA